MDEGMPWGIIMIFFLVGALLGISTEIEMRKKAAKKILSTKKEKLHVYYNTIP